MKLKNGSNGKNTKPDINWLEIDCVVSRYKRGELSKAAS